MQLGHLETPLRILFLFHTDTRLNGLPALAKTTILQECGVSSSKEASSKTPLTQITIAAEVVLMI